MWISKELRGCLDELTGDPATDKRWAELEADLQRFLVDRWITVPSDLYPTVRKSNRDSYMAKLRGEDEVWEIRSCAPRPGIRIFGRFALKDMFIAFTWAWRPELKGEGSAEWREAIGVCGAEWRKVLPSYAPLSGEYPYDYISGAQII